MHAKRFMKAMAENIERYEAAHGSVQDIEQVEIPLNFGGSNVANKPPHWEYMNVPERVHLYNAYKKIIELRLNNIGADIRRVG